jgi:hypothetical protein
VDNDNKENAKEQYFGTAWDLGKGCRIEKGNSEEQSDYDLHDGEKPLPPSIVRIVHN